MSMLDNSANLWNMFESRVCNIMIIFTSLIQVCLTKFRGYDNICSVQALANMLDRHSCIQHRPSTLVDSVVPICGNHIRESGEECDCFGDEFDCIVWYCDDVDCTELMKTIYPSYIHEITDAKV